MIESFNKKELEGKIDQYVNGQLSAREIDELWAELIQDGYHLDYLKSVANLKKVIERRREQREARKQRRQWYYAAAAAVVLLLVIGGVLNTAIWNSTFRVKPIANVELDYYRSGSGALTTDGESKIVQQAISLANTGKVGEAISLLKEELQKATEPSWIAKLSLNLGSLHYNQGEYRTAIDYYAKVIANRNHVDVLMLEKAYWYSGNAYFQTDQLAEARSHIEKAYELNGAYRRVTRSYLNALSE